MAKSLKDALKAAITTGTLTLKKQGSAGNAGQTPPKQEKAPEANSDLIAAFYRGAERTETLKRAATRKDLTGGKGKTLKDNQLSPILAPGVHGVYNKRGKGPPVAADNQAATVDFAKSGPFNVPAEWREDPGGNFELLRLKSRGTAKQIAKTPRDHATLILGFDFGTSCAKAVIRDVNAQRSYAVPFSTRDESRFLLPSRANRLGKEFFLDGPGRVIRDLKLRVLHAQPGDAEAFDDACAFLALGIRHCRAWLLEEHAKVYKHHELEWQLNLGLPARSYEDAGRVDLFRRLAWVAANAAASKDEYINLDLIERWRKVGASNDSPDAEFSWDDVDVIPEIAAQAHGFVQGADWDHKHYPMMLLVDVGAGTVDTAFLSVTEAARRKLKFSFFSNSVEQHGAIDLHRHRVSWLLKQLEEASLLEPKIKSYLDRIYMPTDRLSAVPESVHDYVPGISINAGGGAQTIDGHYFASRFRRQVFATIGQARKTVPRTQCQGMPLILCGGASRMNFYQAIVDEINADRQTGIRVERRSLPDARDLIADGLGSNDRDRLSVAYGLSRANPGDERLGRYIRSVDIPELPPLPGSSYRDRYIDK